MLITEDQKILIIEAGNSLIGKTKLGLNCTDFIKKIYYMSHIDTNFSDCPIFSFSEILEKKAIGLPIFLHRKKTKLQKRITHMGIIFPEKHILHYSRWMEEERDYKVHLSSFDEVFEIYDFVEL